MMNKDFFVGSLVGALKSAFPKADVTQDTILHINEVKDVICVKIGNIAPAIYIDNIYDRYMNGEKDVILSVINTINEIRLPDGFEDTDIEQYKDNLFMQLINTDANKELLNNVPHREIEDLSIIYKIKIRDDLNSITSTIVTNEMMKFWGETEEDLYNRQRTREIMPENIMPLDDLMKVIDPFYDETTESSPLIYISNQHGYNGSIAILYPGVLDEVCERLNTDNLLVLPSSIHECLALSEEFSEDRELISLVRSINAGVVEPQLRLSSNVYYYKKGSGKIMGTAKDKVAIL